MASPSTTRDRVWGSVTTERDKAFLATVALHPHGQLWFYDPERETWCTSFMCFLSTNMVYTCTASIEDPPKWIPRINHSHTSRTVLPKS